MAYGTGWFSITSENGVITLRPIEIQEAKTEQEYIDELIRGIHKT